MSLLILEVLIESVSLETGVSSETSAAYFAVERRFRVMSLGDMALKFSIRPRTKGAFVNRAVHRFHVIDGVLIVDFFIAHATGLQSRGLDGRVEILRTAAFN